MTATLIPLLLAEPKLKPVYDAGPADWIFPVVIGSGILLLGATLFDLLRRPTETKKLLWLGFWALGPALWFTMEYHWLYPAYGRDPEKDFARFQHGQEVARNLWAGIVLLVGTIAMKKEGIRVSGDR